MTFAPGDVERTITIATVHNDAVNLGRTFFVVLSDATAPVARAAAICTIVDYGAPPRRRAAGH